jgi:hypothetical protein
MLHSKIVKHTLPLVLGLTSLGLSAQNHCLNFDGTNDRVDCGNASSVQITGSSITLEAWIYPTSWQPNFWQGNIINKELNGPNNGYMLRVGGGGFLNFNLGSGVWNELTSSTAVLTLNTWQHIAGVYDGSYLRLYVNGVATDSLAATMSIANATGKNLTIGDWSSIGRHFEGSIDEARVWNVARSTSDIQNSMNSELCNQAGLVAYYKFNQGIAQGNNSSIIQLIDASGNNNHGTLTSFALTGPFSNWDTSAAPLLFTYQRATQPSLSFSKTKLCTGISDSAVITISGNLNDAQRWQLYELSCGGTKKDSAIAGKVTVKPSTTRFFYIRGEGNCVDPGPCAGQKFTVHSNPILTFSVKDEHTGNDGEIDLTVTASPPPFVFDWDNDGTGDKDDTEDLTGLSGGTYTVVVEDTNGCRGTGSAVVNPGTAIGVNEKTPSTALQLYPNPTTTFITFDLSSNSTTLQSIKVINIMGQEVATFGPFQGGKKYQINMKSLEQGIYFFRITENEQTTIKTVRVIVD